MKYERLTYQKYDENIDLTQEYGYSYIYKRLYELEDKIEAGILVELSIIEGSQEGLLKALNQEIYEFCKDCPAWSGKDCTIQPYEEDCLRNKINYKRKEIK